MKSHLFQSSLILEDGSHYKGWSLFDQFETVGEIVFNTGMTGYQEIMTDPSYYHQIIIFTYPEIGNTGINNYDYESSALHIKGIVAKEFCSNPSNWRKHMSFPEYLIKYKVPHIFGIDTRSLTQYIRNKGVMKAIISFQSNYQLVYQKLTQSLCSNNIRLMSSVTTKKPCSISSNRLSYDLYSYLNKNICSSSSDLPNVNIVIIDFGIKFNIIKRLMHYGCKINILPANTDYMTILSYKPDGVLLSNGPGDPAVLKFSINTIKQLVMFANIPIFGICMGHQLLSLALQANTFKLKFGHRGLNHPSGFQQISEITSQNHGFAINLDTSVEFQKVAQITHFNLNDRTVAGFFHLSKPIFSVQYHPEASPGPHDSDYLFKYFIDLVYLMKSNL